LIGQERQHHTGEVFYNHRVNNPDQVAQAWACWRFGFQLHQGDFQIGQRREKYTLATVQVSAHVGGQFRRIPTKAMFMNDGGAYLANQATGYATTLSRALN
jgi:hypothetical protein